MESVSFGKKARKRSVKMTELALAHPYMTSVIAIFAIYAFEITAKRILNVVVAIAWRKRDGSVEIK